MAKSVVDIALENIDAQIRDLNRAKEIILAANVDAVVAGTDAPKKRGRKRKAAGLPVQDAGI
jgi:hypothetical protein